MHAVCPLVDEANEITREVRGVAPVSKLVEVRFEGGVFIVSSEQLAEDVVCGRNGVKTRDRERQRESERWCFPRARSRAIA